MIKEINELKTMIKAANQRVMHAPKLVRIKEYFPQENAVTIQLIGKGDDFGGAVSKNIGGEQRFALGYRGDVTEASAPQPGDLGYLFFTGMQYKNGFVLLAHSEGGEKASSYVPIRGAWGI